MTEKKNTLTKLHKQFGHCSANRLKQLLKTAGNNDVSSFSMLEEIIENCDVCKKYKKPVPRPVVGFPLANDFNQTVAVDLHQLEHNLYYLHIIDEFSRFSAGCITSTKHSSQFVQNFIKNWISIHGAPQRLFSDLGGEFNNAEVQDMAENFNMEIITTAGYSPWSNGLLERHNQTLTEILLKIKHDKQLDWETAISWALMAKNSLQNVHGYSPYQLVFGRNPNLPSTLIDRPPALEGTTTSDVVRSHINALHSAKESFVKAECSERIRRALRKQIRPTSEFCEPGDKIYYKRPDSQEWKGPGVVIGQDGPIVFVRHGGMIVRVHKCRLRKVNQPENDNKDPDQNRDELVQNLQDNQPDSSSNNQIENESDDEVILEETGADIDNDHNIENDVIDDDNELNVENPNIRDNDNVEPIRNPHLVIKPGQIVKYSHMNNDDVIQAKVLSRAGKSSGNKKHWFNIQVLDPSDIKDEKMSIDLSQVTDLEIVQPRIQDSDENVLITDDVKFKDAKLKELQCWKLNNVFEEVKDEGQKCVSTRWVCSLKSTPNGIIPKARLVARGFEEYNNDLQKDSPTCAHESLRLIMAVTAQRQWQLHSMDIKTAFLQGQPMDREVFIRPPKEANCDGVWLLNKCVYGLSDASLHWYKKVKSVMTEQGAFMSKVDPTVFYWKDKEDTVMGILACHVDDFIWSGNRDFDKIMNNIRTIFQVGKEDEHAFKYCGINLTSNGSEIFLDQNRYTDNISPIYVDPTRALEKDSPLVEREIHSLRSKVGQLLWLSHQSRPDLLFDTCNAAVTIKNSTVKDMLVINKVIVKAKSSKMTLKYQYLGDDNNLRLMVFSDAALGNLPDGGSQGGYLILLVGQSGKFSPIWWNSKKIRRVVRSTLAAETISMSEAIDMAVFLATLFAELTTGKPQPKILPIVCVTDCKSLFEAVQSSKFVTEKRLRIDISGIREIIDSGQIQEFQWLDTKRQLADCLTKRGASPLLLRSVIQEGVLHQ